MSMSADIELVSSYVYELRMSDLETRCWRIDPTSVNEILYRAVACAKRYSVDVYVRGSNGEEVDSFLYKHLRGVPCSQ